MKNFFSRHVLERILNALMLCAGLLLPTSAAAQFTDISAGLTGVFSSSVAWGDYDNDGDLDILLTGFANGNIRTAKVYQNNAGVFTDIGAGLTAVTEGSAAWGDYDNDGDLDILLTGEDDGFNLIAKIYRNDSGVFTDIGAGLTGVALSAVAWGDYDNDGDLDILLTGINSGNAIAKIYRNNSGVFTEIVAGLTGVNIGAVAWGDYDNDGDLDILLAGDAVGSAIAKVYRNDSGVFTDISAGLTGVYFSSVAWGDYDNDGDLDILLSGTELSATTKIYQNTAGVFAEVSAGLTQTSLGTVAWGDYDSDGDLDLLQTGSSLGVATTKVYRNDSGSFTDTGASLTGAASSSAAWGDYDNDGDLDILLTGRDDADNRFAKIYRNDGSVFNTVPAAPTNLSQSVSGNSVTFTWAASTDTQTPSAGLTYNLMVGTTSNGIDINSPMADVSNGYRRVVRLGGVNLNTSWTLYDLPVGTYFWRVQAVDAAFAGSPFSAEGTFEITPPYSPFVFLANKVTLKRTKQDTPGGDIHSNGTLTVEKGDPSTYESNLTAVGKITINKENTINGNVKAPSISNSGKINGTKTIGALANEPLPSLSYGPISGPNKTVAKGKSLTLAPGSYGIVTVNSSGTLKLSSGEYFIKELRGSSSGIVIEIDLSSGDPVTINMQSNLQLGKEAEIRLLPNGETDSKLVTFNTLQTTAADWGREAYLLGSFNAPNAVVTLVKNTQLRGSICAKEILVSNDCLFLHHNSPGSLPGPGDLPKSSFDDVDEQPATSDQQQVTSYALEQNYPNPFNPTTTISFQLPEAGEVSLSIFNTNGQLVKKLVAGEMSAGRHNLTWDATNERGERVASGVYLYVIKAGEFTAQRKLVLMK
ncbi:hypothetical protein DCC62_14105 [candidate division KSB1 bacterium]|nr:MAG: hypothetical protein DCC62_14105 [candidate division KSB1 bacterium]